MSQSKVFVVCFLLFSSWCYGQNNFKSAKIILHNGDTLIGSINYRNWNRNPSQIQFRKTNDVKVNTYSPLDINVFEVEGDKYYGAIVEKEVSPIKSFKLHYDGILNIKKDTVFLQSLIEGEKSFLKFKDFNNKDHFYIKENKNYILLRYKKFYKNDNHGTQHIVEKKTICNAAKILL